MTNSPTTDAGRDKRSQPGRRRSASPSEERADTKDLSEHPQITQMATSDKPETRDQKLETRIRPTASVSTSTLTSTFTSSSASHSVSHCTSHCSSESVGQKTLHCVTYCVADCVVNSILHSTSTSISICIPTLASTSTRILNQDPVRGRTANSAYRTVNSDADCVPNCGQGRCGDNDQSSMTGCVTGNAPFKPARNPPGSRTQPPLFPQGRSQP
jgi:hypothetical protein